MADPQVRTLAEARQHIASLTARVQYLEHTVSDLSQRLDTAQTRTWRRWWWWLRWGWSLTDWNQSEPAWRPWNRQRTKGPR
jgi:hypothetical protein